MTGSSSTVSAPPLPQTPQAPAPPPMFGMNSTAGSKIKKNAMQSFGFGSTILGGGNPTNTGLKTLLGL